MQKTLFIAISVLLLFSCGNTYEYWEVSKFTIVENALQNDEEVTMIYYSRGPENGESYYRHAVVINADNDTLNVLTFPTSSLNNITESDRTFIYNDRPVLSDIPGLSDSNTYGVDPEKVTWARLSQVFRDPKFDHITDNDFPTVIGSLTKR
jgi:hypothetical protein